MTLYIALCDDEMSDLTQEKEIIESVLPSLSSNIKWDIDKFSSSEDLLNSDKTYNMVFLDVEMQGMNGIETAEALHEKSPMSFIFFVTHHEDYMDEALNKQAFRFWTKPISKPRLIYGLQSAIREIEANRKSIAVTVENKTVKIFLKDIIYIYHSNRLTYIITTKEEMQSYDTLKSVIDQLTGECFIQTHASCYVNLNFVSNYDKTDILCEFNGKTYKPYISARKYSAFNKRFKEWSCDLQ